MCQWKNSLEYMFSQQLWNKNIKIQWNCLNRTLSKHKTCLNQTECIVPSTKCICNLNLCKPNTCLRLRNSSVSKGFGLDRFYSSNIISKNVNLFILHRLVTIIAQNDPNCPQFFSVLYLYYYSDINDCYRSQWLILKHFRFQ